MSVIIYWHRNDLRIHDNEALQYAASTGLEVMPIYIFDPEDYRRLALGFQKIGMHRFRYLCDTLVNLQESYQSLGGSILTKVGSPATVLADLSRAYDVKEVVYQRELASEELAQEDAVDAMCDDHNISVKKIWGRTLYHIDDLPFSQEEIPLTSKTFRVTLTKATKPRDLIQVPSSFHWLLHKREFSLPEPSELGYDAKDVSTCVQLRHPAGETAAMARLDYYTFQTENLTNYRWTRNRSLSMDYSSKLSPYLALGSLSPRLVYHEVKRYEADVKRNISTWWLIFEVVWRDYFTFRHWRFGDKVFRAGGIKNRDREWNHDQDLYHRWCTYSTGIPWVDAHMKELATTGFMSNRGRVNVSSFLSRDYQVDWRWGAAWFEHHLLDYDVHSNWGNWNTQATEIYYTNPTHQSWKYDRKGEYVTYWFPELKSLPGMTFHLPWTYSDEELAQHDIYDYTRPVEIYKKWSRAIGKLTRGDKK